MTYMVALIISYVLWVMLRNGGYVHVYSVAELRRSYKNMLAIQGARPSSCLRIGSDTLASARILFLTVSQKYGGIPEDQLYVQVVKVQGRWRVKFTQRSTSVFDTARQWVRNPIAWTSYPA